jgi:hypothetical protein
VITDTTGGRGGEMTREFANMIKQIAEQMALDPNADPGLLHALTDMADKGHEMAGTELEYARTVSGTPTPDDMVMISSKINSARDFFRGEMLELDAYLQENPGKMPPELLSVVKFAHQSATTISESYNANYLDIGNMTPAEWAVGNVVLTDHHANTICGSGGDTTKCIEMQI